MLKEVEHVQLLATCRAIALHVVSRAFGEGAWPPPRITEDPPLVIVIMYFRIKVRKRFIGDILHIVILDFSDNILTLSVKIWCPGLVKRNYGQLGL